jgi:methylated-DNA-[protein]-cysteine S-methyltransferase
MNIDVKEAAMTNASGHTYDSPVGRLALAASNRGLTRISYGSAVPSATAGSAAQAWLDLARRELDDYFAGRLRRFSVPVDLDRVDDARRRILDGLADVGYGETTTYGALAARLGLVDDGPRQVGVAMARNPVAIVVPCHRVVGAGGALTGYGGGLAAKQALLDLEARDRPGQLTIAI